MNKELYIPEIIRVQTASGSRRLHNLKTKGIFLVDQYNEQVEELSLVLDPAQKNNKHNLGYGVWVYYPWRSTAVRVLEKRWFERLRVSRNSNLIFPHEQKKFASIRVGIAGLNVGNPAAICLALEGGAHRVKFADNDHLSLTNLNRFRAGLSDLGLNKAILSARQVYEINPFAKIEVWPRGLTKETIDQFLLKSRLDVVIEEMDNLPLKIFIRKRARVHRIPILMVTGNGENVIVDIERFDQNPRLKILNGYLKSDVMKRIDALNSETTPIEKIALARDFMGSSFLTQRLRDSFIEVGKTLAGIPQLAEASFLRGAVLAFLIRQIAVGAKVSSGRYELSLTSMLKKSKK